MIQLITDLQDYLWPQGKVNISAVPMGGLTNVPSDVTAVAPTELTTLPSGDVFPSSNVNPVAAVLSPVPQVIKSNRWLYLVIGAIAAYFLVIRK